MRLTRSFPLAIELLIAPVVSSFSTNNWNRQITFLVSERMNESSLRNRISDDSTENGFSTVNTSRITSTTSTTSQDQDKLCTTNAEDQEAVARLKSRLDLINGNESNVNEHNKMDINPSWTSLPNVFIDEGANKYVLLRAETPVSPDYVCDNKKPNLVNFVVSKKGAPYHRNAAEPMIDQLESFGFKNIRVTGGGRILMDEAEKRISIYGFSYGFGQADHSISKSVVEGDARYVDFTVTWSNSGY